MSEERVTRGHYSSVDEMMADMDRRDAEERKKHPIKYFMKRVRHEIKYLCDLPGDLYRELKWFIQRGKRGWSDRDGWSIDWHLSEILPAMLKNLKEYHYGVCGGLVKEQEDLLKKNNPNMSQRDIEDKAVDLADDVFNSYLDEMIWTFEFAMKISNSEINMPFEGYEKLRGDKNWRFATKREIRRFNKGFNLFKKYFFNLND